MKTQLKDRLRNFMIAMTIIIFSSFGSLAQSVSINTSGNPAYPGTILDVSADSSAVLLPRTDTSSILDPARGFLIYDTLSASFYQYNGLQWSRLLDEAAFKFYFADRDGDGFGDKFSALYAVHGLPNFVLDSSDCDDGATNINPGQNDICDGIDNDCNSVTADGSQDPMIGTPCDGIDSDFCEDGVLSCVGGTLTCVDDTDDHLDICDGIDNDCNLATEDGSQDPLIGTPCDGPDSDQCEDGEWSCVGGSLTCVGDTVEHLDICDGIDNDCNPATEDGSQDPLIGTPCDGTDSDQCEDGEWSCVGGTLTCVDDTEEHIEVCDGIDNDCDGETDEGCSQFSIEWGNLNAPSTTTTSTGVPTESIYGLVFVNGVTDSSGQGAGIIAQIGYGANGSDPALGNWTWSNATFNSDSGNNDEYVASLTTLIAGTYDYAYRYSGDWGVTWLYCDLEEGSSNGYSSGNAGDLTVN